MRKCLFTTLMLIAIVTCGMSVQADEVRKECVQLSPEGGRAAVVGRITGYESVHYTVSARAGQAMGILLHTDNPSAYFNVFVPGKRPGQDSAMFVGSVDGVRFAGTLPADGDYTVQSAPVNLKVTHASPGRSSTQPARFLAYAIGLNPCIPVNVSAMISGLKESMRRVPKDAPVPTHSICI